MSKFKAWPALAVCFSLHALLPSSLSLYYIDPLHAPNLQEEKNSPVLKAEPYCTAFP